MICKIKDLHRIQLVGDRSDQCRLRYRRPDDPFLDPPDARVNTCISLFLHPWGSPVRPYRATALRLIAAGMGDKMRFCVFEICTASVNRRLALCLLVSFLQPFMKARFF
jgi:hypothetical protein